MFGKSKITRRNDALSFDGCERLEQRQMMAGDVTAAMTAAGDLRIIGDHLDNQLEVSETTTATPDGTVRGVEVNGQNGTTINGEQRVFFSFGENGLRDIKLNMKGGSDLVELQNLNARNVNALMKSGTDAFQINGGRYSGNVRINLGSSGADHNYVNRYVGVPDDFANKQEASIDQAQIDNTLFVLGGSSGDRISFRNSQVDRAILKSGAGDDWVDLVNSNVMGRSLIATGSGNDNFNLGSVNVHTGMTLLTGSGDDAATIAWANIDSASINMGSGQDLLIFPTIVMMTDSTANGGAQANEITGRVPDTLTVSNFDAATGNHTTHLPEARVRTETYTVLVPEQRTRMETYVDENGVQQTREVTYTVMVPQTRVRQVTYTVMVSVTVAPN